MPKGDRERLKADPDDGTTPIANLLLEAAIMAKVTSKCGRYYPQPKGDKDVNRR